MVQLGKLTQQQLQKDAKNYRTINREDSGEGEGRTQTKVEHPKMGTQTQWMSMR